jgi:DNA modification methylase
MKLETVPLSSISPDPANTRKHSRRNLDAIKASLRRFGQQKPIVVDEKGVVLAGNGTLAAATELGWSEIQIVRTALAGVDATAFGIADNRTAELAEWDENLADVLASLKAEDFPLAEIGFDEADLAELAGEPEPSDADAEPQIDKAEELRAKWGVELGQVWQLGEHRIACGDSTQKETVKILMRGEVADICFTSPPYGLGKSVALSGNRAMAKRGNAYDAHEDNPDEWASLMRRWFESSREAVASAWVVNIQPLAGNKRDLVRFIADNADRLVDVATWDKGRSAPQMAAGVLSSRFEWILIFGSEKNASRVVPCSSWHGTVESLYVGPPQKDNQFASMHAATMPLHLPIWVMQTLCNKSQTVFEPFCGTGTTMIACEQLGRKCRAIELSPAYVAVSIQRWADATGKEPRKL